MAALGRLARSVAHDINNVFNLIAMTGFLVEERGDEELRRQGASIRRTVGLGGGSSNSSSSSARRRRPRAGASTWTASWIGCGRCWAIR